LIQDIVQNVTKSVGRAALPPLERMMPDNKDINWGKLASSGFEIAAGVGLGTVVGLWCDRKFGSSPWGLIIGLVLGCAGGMYLLIKETIRANKD
jgi:F0F1-type ATP synthase assembly protein I